MIYNSDYFKEEMKKSYLEGTTSTWKLCLISVFVALFSFGINMFFIAMVNSVVADYFVQCTGKSFFSIMSIFNFTAIVFFELYIVDRYQSITFCEINRNRWYMLRKMGYSASNIVFSKQIATLLMGVAIYGLGIIFSTMLAAILGYSMEISILPSFAIVGLLQILCIISTFMMISHFVKRRIMAFLIVTAELIVMFVIANICGFIGIEKEVTNMQNVTKLFVGLPSIYTYMLFGMIAISITISTILGQKRAERYHVKSNELNGLYVVNYKTEKVAQTTTIETAKTKKILKTILCTGLVALLFAACAANILLAVIGSGANNNKVGAYRPFEFGSSTMSPYIEKNDFVLFKNEGVDFEYKKGDVISFKDVSDSSSTIIKVIKDITDDGNYVVDIAIYPDTIEEGTQVETISKSEITGVLVYKNRWLGAWMLLNNYTLGKVFTLGIPLVILAFYDKIVKIVNAIRKSIGLDRDI